MISAFSRGTAAAVLCAVTASAAQADLTAQDVWSDWRAYLLGTGYAVSGSEQMSGDTLTVSDMTLTLDLPDDEATFEVQMGDLSFTENGDGTVAIGFPNEMPIILSGEDDSDGQPFEAVIIYAQTGFSMVASGDPDALTYNYTASSVELYLDQVTTGDEVLAPETARFDLTLTNIIGSTQVEGTDLRSYTQKAQVGELSYDIAISDPEGEGTGQLAWSGGADGFEVDSFTALPGTMDPEDMLAMIEAGFAADGIITYGPGSSSLSFQEPGESFSYESSSDGGAFEFLFGPEGAGYAMDQSNIAINLAGSEIPLPISVNMGELGFSLLVPLMQGEEPQDFALTVDFTDFTMSDLIWGIFDPTGQLPRDPATILIALQGQARLLADLLDPEVAAQMESGPPPAELEALTIEALEVTAAGASLTGQGDFTFDNSDLTTFDGMPRPTGALDLQLVGGNGLLDKLVAMGLLPSDEAGGVRMMMGLFSVPGEGEDTLNSRIEINDQGHILANGQRIQ